MVDEDDLDCDVRVGHESGSSVSIYLLSVSQHLAVGECVLPIVFLPHRGSIVDWSFLRLAYTVGRLSQVT